MSDMRQDIDVATPGVAEAAPDVVEACEGAPAHEDGQAMKQSNTFLRSFSHAASGVAQAFEERNFKVDCAIAVLALVLCALLRVSAWGWAAVLICIGVQLSAECVNTAIEAVVDVASPEWHPLAKRAKDCAAGAALITACASVAVGCVVYLPAIFALVAGA